MVKRDEPDPVWIFRFVSFSFRMFFFYSLVNPARAAPAQDQYLGITSNCVTNV
ncbi:Uncharacterised protein [uncultured Eubacterium sp.]|nr:Uncharacterised protein [uncultured Eubacterium sp.]